MLAYAKTFGIPVEEVTKDNRQIGKVLELSMQYGGSVGAFTKMASAFGVSLPDDEILAMVKMWRAAHPQIVKAWRDIEDAAMKAVATGREIRVNDKLSFAMEGEFLVFRTIAGSAMHYYKPAISEIDSQWGKRTALTFMGVNSVSRKFERQDTYGGKLFENAVQHLARIVLTDTMLDLDEAGFDIRLHIHDQIVALVPENDPKLTVELYESLMVKPKEWAKDLPLAAEGEMLKRFKKG